MPFHMAPYDDQLPPSTVVRILNKDVVVAVDLLQPFFHRYGLACSALLLFLCGVGPLV